MSQIQVIKNKIHSAASIAATLSIWRMKSQKIVFTNGCFDIIHRGHIDYLSKAADLGDRLVIGLNSDESVRMLGKDASRPLQDEESRAMILAALGFTDAVVIFGESTPYELIRLIQPHVLVKGSDYKIDAIVGADIVLENGGEVRTLEFLEGYSTSNIVKKIKE